MKRKLLLVSLVAIVAVSLGVAARNGSGGDGGAPYASIESTDCFFQTDVEYSLWSHECECYRCNWTHRCVFSGQGFDGCYKIHFESRIKTYKRRLCCMYPDSEIYCDDWEITGQDQECRQVSQQFIDSTCGCPSASSCGSPVCECCDEGPL